MWSLGGSFKKGIVETLKPRKCLKCQSCLLQETLLAFSLWSNSSVTLAVDVAGEQLHKINKDRTLLIVPFQRNKNWSRICKICLVLAWVKLMDFVGEGHVYCFVSERVWIVPTWCTFVFQCLQVILIHRRQHGISAGRTCAWLCCRALKNGRLFSKETTECEICYLAEFRMERVWTKAARRSSLTHWYAVSGIFLCVGWKPSYC